jgi:hypothetical protein
MISRPPLYSLYVLLLEGALLPDSTLTTQVLLSVVIPLLESPTIGQSARGEREVLVSGWLIVHSGFALPRFVPQKDGARNQKCGKSEQRHRE